MLLNKIGKLKDEAHKLFAPYIIVALEKRAFDHLTGKIDEKEFSDKIEDFSPIFETLIDNEYEF